MLGLPKTTEINRQLSKKKIFSKFHLNTAEKEEIDRDISKIMMVNEVSSTAINIAEGDEANSFYVLRVYLKRRDYSERTIIQLFNLIHQNLILILSFEDEARVAIYRSKLFQTAWKPVDELKIDLQGLDFDKVWENVILQVSDLSLKDGLTIDEQIELSAKKEKLQADINRLDRKARAEKQPKRKYELVAEIRDLQKAMEEL